LKVGASGPDRAAARAGGGHACGLRLAEFAEKSMESSAKGTIMPGGARPHACARCSQNGTPNW
jgi:hypothetical protein